jgi:hypothetical protein
VSGVLLSARIVGSVYFNETINCERYVQVILRQVFPELTEEETLWLVSASLSYWPCCRLCPRSLGAELTAVVFGQHVHLTLIFVTFSSGVV